MSKLTMTVVAVLAGMAVTPAYALGSLLPSFPNEWPVEGAFDHCGKASGAERANLSTRSAPQSAEPVIEDEEARGR